MTINYIVRSTHAKNCEMKQICELKYKIDGVYQTENCDTIFLVVKIVIDLFFIFLQLRQLVCKKFDLYYILHLKYNGVQ